MVDSPSKPVVLSANELGPWAESIGLEVTRASGDEVQATWRVTAVLTQPYGYLHGGVHCSVVETPASLGASIWLGERGRVLGLSNSTSFFRACAVRDLLSSIARPIEQGPEGQVWQVNTKNEQRGLVSQGTVRLHHRSARLPTEFAEEAKAGSGSSQPPVCAARSPMLLPASPP